MDGQHEGSDGRGMQGRRLIVVAGCVAVSVFALLLWGRLKLVAGVPRTALAEPENGAAAGTAAQGRDGEDRSPR